ncbi:MAG: dTDP-glucose 4,6-dehydratase [Phycisphaerales bacterium]|nr:dTDP-glucose 4,6-dehydratase [Phycisphaerales bacterium]
MQRVLVTGGAGFIGSNFVRYVLRAEPGIDVFNLDALTYAGSRANLTELTSPERHHLIVGDICDRALVDRILAEHRIDTIVHFAAESHVDRSITGPGAFIQTNVVGTFTLLDAARHAWKTADGWRGGVRFHHVSTDEVFGSLTPTEPAFTEENPYRPNSPYAASKASSDHLVRAYAHTFGLPITISNCSNNYGPYQFPEKLIPLMIHNGLNGKPLPVYGDGMQVRDWLYVTDHCEAIHRILRRGTPGETYNVGGNAEVPNLEIVRTLCAILDELVPASPHRPHANLVKFVTDRPGHDRRYAMNISKIARELDWRPRHDLAGGLRDTVKWYLENAAWLDAIRKQGDYQAWIEKNYDKRTEAVK